QNGWFVDYVHPDIRGHELLADSIVRALSHENLLAPAAEWRFGSEPTSQQYLERGGWNPAGFAAMQAHLALSLLVKTCHNEVRGEEVTAGARRLFQQSLALAPRCATAYLGLGMCSILEKKGDEAIESFERARAINPGELDQLWGSYRSNVGVKSLF